MLFVGPRQPDCLRAALVARCDTPAPPPCGVRSPSPSGRAELALPRAWACLSEVKDASIAVPSGPARENLAMPPAAFSERRSASPTRWFVSATRMLLHALAVPLGAFPPGRSIVLPVISNNGRRRSNAPPEPRNHAGVLPFQPADVPAADPGIPRGCSIGANGGRPRGAGPGHDRPGWRLAAEPVARRLHAALALCRAARYSRARETHDLTPRAIARRERSSSQGSIRVPQRRAIPECLAEGIGRMTSSEPVTIYYTDPYT